MVEGSTFLTGFETLLLYSVIGPIVGVYSIQWEKPLQNLAYQWPWDELRKERAESVKVCPTM